MAANSNLEREVKFTAGAEFRLPDFRKVGGTTVRLPEQTLRTKYFDTPDLRLWQRGLTLRHRSGENEAGKWTLKLRAERAEATLDRTELSWDGGPDKIPEEVFRVLAGLVRTANLEQVGELEAVRERIALHGAGGASLAEVDDDVVTVKRGRRDGYSFRQIEIEFTDGENGTDPGIIDGLVSELQRAGASLDQEQKFAKALGLRSPRNSSLCRRASVGDVVRFSITDGLDRLLDYDYLLRLNPVDPPERAVHQARVASRRLRSDLKTFRLLLDPVWLRHTATELKWLGSVLGQVRDADVLARNLFAHEEVEKDLEGSMRLRLRLIEQRRHLSRELARALESGRYRSLVERLSAASHAPPFYSDSTSSTASVLAGPDDPAKEVLPSLVRVPWKKLRKRVRKAGKRPSDRKLHRIRIGAKELRYASEAVAPVIGKRAQRTATRAEQLQTVLGDHHDAVAAEEWLRLAALEGPLDSSFEAGVFTARARSRQQKLRRKWQRPWRSLTSQKVQKWLAQ